VSDIRTVKPARDNSGVPGWFGKIPALGDFATRRLPASFVGPWDEWLSAELAASAEALGGAWGEAYRAAPVLCFCAGPGVIDQHAWHGTVVASYDRVGREFPLTLAAPGAPQKGPETGWGPWVAVARRALIPGYSPAGLDEALAGLCAAPPGPDQTPADLGLRPSLEDHTLPGIAPNARQTHPPTPRPGTVLAGSAQGVAGLHGERECATLCTGASAWWRWSTENSCAAELGTFEGLPQGLYLRVLTG
jgi:type VI secretion system ImpM family protein